MLSVLEIVKRTTDFLEKKGVESPRLNAELLIGHSLGLKRMQLYLQFERPLSETELEKIRPLVKRRGNREPIQHIIGQSEFGGLKLKTDKRALIPRPETEYLIELVKSRLTTAPANILDLGTGGGAIALALAKVYPDALVTGIDGSTGALELARENATACGFESRVRLFESNWFSAFSENEKFELIVANPPYLTIEEMNAASPEVKDFEPAVALAAGIHGTADLEAIISQAIRHLTSGGLLACETGIGQHQSLINLANATGYKRTESLQDLTGRDRYVLAFR